MRCLMLAMQHPRGDPRVQNSIRLLNEIGIEVEHVYREKSVGRGVLGVMRAAFDVLRKIGGVDLVYMHDPLSYVIGIPLALVFGRKMVVDVHEFYKHGYRAKFPSALVIRLANFLHDVVKGRAQFVVVVEKMKEDYPGAVVLSNFRLGELGKPKKLDKGIVLVYSGALMVSHMWEMRNVLLPAEALARRGWRLGDRRVRYRIVGSVSPAVRDYVRRAERLGAELLVRDWIPHEEILREYEKAHVGLLLLKPTFNYRYATANKTSEYLSQGLPIIVSANEHARWLIEKFHCGVFLEEVSEEAFLNALEKVIENYEEMSAGAIAAAKHLLREKEKQEKEFKKAIGEMLEPLPMRK